MTPIMRKTLGASAGGIALVIAGLFAVEGGYSNNPKDPGGETNHGITEAVARKHDYTGPMISLPKEVAEDIYIQDYVIKPGYVQVFDLSPAVATKLIDAGVNTGTYRSSLWFQKSLNAVNNNGRDYSKIVEDGRVGPGTISAYKALQKRRGKVEACKMVIKMVDAQQTVHYMNLNMPTFTAGWVINRSGNVPLSSCQDENRS